jgi:hypothetical protein
MPAVAGQQTSADDEEGEGEVGEQAGVEGLQKASLGNNGNWVRGEDEC